MNPHLVEGANKRAKETFENGAILSVSVKARKALFTRFIVNILIEEVNGFLHQIRPFESSPVKPSVSRVIDANRL